MNGRFVFAGLLSLFMIAPGCGVEGVGNPPDDPSSAAKTNSETSSTDAPPVATAPEASRTSPETTEVPKAGATAETSTASKPSTDKPSSDKPAADKPTSDKLAADKPSTTASDVPGANITIGRLEADGIVTKDIQCKSDGGGGGFGLLGMVLVTAWMSPQKKALDACAPGGKETETRVVWKAQGGKLVEIEVKGDAKVKTCVEKALRPGKPVFEGHCAATVVHGKR